MEYIFNNNHSIFIIEARKRVIDLVTFLVELHNDDLFEEKTYTKFSNLIQELIDLDSVEFIDLKRILKVIDVVSQRLSDYRNNLSIIHFNQKILQIIGMHYNTILVKEQGFLVKRNGWLIFYQEECSVFETSMITTILFLNV